MLNVLEASPLDTMLGNAIFILLSFVLMVALVKKFAWGNIVKIFKDREDRIANDLDSAEADRIKAQELKNQREMELNHARQDSMTIVNEAKEAAERQSKQMVNEAKEDIVTLRNKATQDIEAEKEQAYKNVKDEVASMSLQIASQILNKELDKESHKELIDSCIEGLGKHYER